MKTLEFPNKQIRAQAIKEYLPLTGKTKVVCFSCGNATRALINAGVKTLAIAPEGDFIANRWFTQAEIASMFPDYFDATSGHLPMELMKEIGARFKNYLGTLDGEYMVPTGSGETIVCLKLAYPGVKFYAKYNLNEATEYSIYAPLNEMVEIMADGVEY